MAILHYENLGVSRPHALLQSAFWGLRDFYEYLHRTIRHLEDESTVLRLAWSPASTPDGFDDATAGFWVELREPDDRPNEPERTFDTFLEDDVREVVEMERPRRRDGSTSRPIGVSVGGDRRIPVVDREPQGHRLLLEREPVLPELFLRPNTTTLKRQLAAVRQLQDAPAPTHMPLLRLFERTRDARWPELTDTTRATDWQVLTDARRPGTHEQRAFVEVALRTPDFAILEGPPGSGKTTAICELVLQLVAQGKRTLLCASTHVAVDNVLERLGPLSLQDASDLVPVRVGERSKISDKARPFQLENLVETERRRLATFLRTKRPRTDAQEHLHRTVARAATDREPGAVERMIPDAANLVCGTTTGILSHPDIRNASAVARAGMFDVLILDEASKTTFQEFLVPALLARQWIVVGDPRQLSPFVDEVAMDANLVAAVPDRVSREACVDVFLGAEGQKGRRSAVVVSQRPEDDEKYRLQGMARGVVVLPPGDEEVGLAQIVIGAREAIAVARDDLPADVGTVRGDTDAATIRRARAYRQAVDIRDDEPPRWERELGWRLSTHYELRQARNRTSASDLLREIEVLMPVGIAGERNGAAERVDRVRRVAFPSVLESLQCGFERANGQRDGSALTDGLPERVLGQRHVLLAYQHRMHPDISALPRCLVYDGDALRDPPDMADRRTWSYAGYQRRAIWLQVEGRFQQGRNRNPDEAEAIMHELERFRLWAEGAPKRVEGGATEP